MRLMDWLMPAPERRRQSLNNRIVPGFDDEVNDCIRIGLQLVGEVRGCLLLYLRGYVDYGNFDYFADRVSKAIDLGYIRLIFNCTGMNMVSDAIITAWTLFLKIIKPRGGDIVLVDVQPKVYECFQLLGFAQFMNIEEDLGKAVEYFNSR